MHYILIRNTCSGCEAVTDSGDVISYPYSAVRLISMICLHNGSSLEGRMESFRYLTKTTQKSAVLLSERSMQILFPTLGFLNHECVWISYNDLLDFSRTEATSVRIRFINGYSQTLDIDSRVIRNQVNRCRRYLKELDGTSGSVSESEALLNYLKA
jgi:competence transcription factor ComK